MRSSFVDMYAIYGDKNNCFFFHLGFGQSRDFLHDRSLILERM